MAVALAARAMCCTPTAACDSIQEIPDAQMFHGVFMRRQADKQKLDP
jgi:hypothetical protein